jgi:hypothetical protein
MGAVVKLADEVRDALGAPVTFRNGVRPWWINQQVASSGVASDHPMAAACDLDLSKSGDLKAAHEAADEIYHRHAEDLRSCTSASIPPTGTVGGRTSRQRSRARRMCRRLRQRPRRLLGVPHRRMCYGCIPVLVRRARGRKAVTLRRARMSAR